MKITKSQLKKIIKEEVETLKEGYKPDHRRAAFEILDIMLSKDRSRGEILDDILQFLPAKESHGIMLILADDLSKDMGEPLVVDPDLRNPREQIPYGSKTK